MKNSMWFGAGIIFTLVILWIAKFYTTIIMNDLNFLTIGVAIICFVVVLFLVYAAISSPKDKTAPLGLPSGSIRAMIALLVLVFFVLISLTFHFEYPADKELISDILKTVGTLLIAVSAFYFGSKATEQGSKIANEAFASRVKSQEDSDTDVPTEIIQEALAQDNNKEKWKKDYQAIDIVIGKKEIQNTTHNLNCLVFIVESKDNRKDAPPIPSTITYNSGGKAYDIPTDVQVQKTANETDEMPLAGFEVLTDAAKTKGKEWIDSFPNVVGISVRNKVTNDKETKMPALVFKVLKKEINPDFGKIPRYLVYDYKGKSYNLITDVEEEDKTIAYISSDVLSDTPIIVSQPPLPLGNSICRSGENKNTGSIGLVLKKNDDANNEYIISCYHVLCSPELKKEDRNFEDEVGQEGSAVISPSLEDSGTINIGHVIKGKMDDENDFAIARLIKKGEVDNGKNKTLQTTLSEFGFVFHENIGETLTICGRSSGIGQNTIKSHFAPQTIFYFGEQVKQFFKGLIEVEKFSVGGDSGGVVINEKNQVVGLLIAGNSKSSYVLPVREFINNNGYSLKI